ncbi:MAG: helix-turn-helix domain-containing protein, partial [Clostridia bacterium]
QALEYLRRQPADVVLTDIRMPVMDGLALARAMRQEKLPTRVVIISAYRDFEYAREAMQLGIRHYMVKSTKFDELIEIFQSIKQELDEQLPDLPPMPMRGAKPEEHGDRTIEKLNQYLSQNLAAASLQTAAAHVGLSPVYLSRFFKEKMGVNFIDYLVNLKMERAAQLLAAGKHRMGEISEIVGYSNEKNFARAFKKQYGISPNEYQRLA